MSEDAFQWYRVPATLLESTLLEVILQRIVFDGHDASGKTTWAKKTSEYLGRYCRARYVKPFSDSIGDLITWLFYKGDVNLLNTIALTAIRKIEEENSTYDVLIYDRHWLSIFTLIDHSRYEVWYPLPVTFLCWTTPDITRQRLSARSTAEEDNKWDHEYYCSIYKQLAHKYGIDIIDTSSIKLRSIDDLAVEKLVGRVQQSIEF